MADAKAFWDKVAPKYAAQPVKDPGAYAHTLDRTRTYLAETDRVLELGCGTGSTALLLAKDVAHITATDLAPRMIEIAKTKVAEQGVGNVEFRAADLTQTDTDGTPYDVILAFNLLHLIRDRAGAVRRSYEMLKPGGYFISKTVCLRENGWIMWIMVAVLRAVGIAPYVAILGITELEKTLRDAGFEIVETGDYPKKPVNRFVVARKV
jgi:2-polyprenyl-3-methyl-5-hydroxy-6-metoxy-1,4-benzoquinol methylase